MSMQAKLADRILRDKYGVNLYEWAMQQRRGVNPPSWDEVAEKLHEATDEEISVGGQVLRRWLMAFEEDLKAGEK